MPTTTTLQHTTAVHRVPLPASEPPFDDECEPGQRAGMPTGVRQPLPSVATQGSLALAHVLPGGVPAVPEPATSLRLVDLSDDPVPPQEGGHAAGTPTRSAEPDPRRWSARLAQGIAEALHGHRPLQQLARWTDEEVYATLTRRITGRRPADSPRPVVRSVRICRPCQGVVEATAVVDVSGRCRALAMRLEADHGHWRCTALDVL